MSEQAKRPADQVILDELRKRGDTLTALRHTLAYFYLFADDQRSAELTLNPMAQRLLLSGWAIVDLRADALIVEGQRAVDPASLNVMIEEMEALASEFGVEFDGWECAIVGGGP
jgi:hypothetical protein